MKRNLLAFCLVLMFFPCGCYLKIVDVNQPMTVCVGTPFNVTVNALSVIDEAYQDNTAIGSAVLLPDGWQVVSCVVFGSAAGVCVIDANVTNIAAAYSPPTPDMTWHGYSLVLPDDVDDGESFDFVWTIQPTSAGTFMIKYFSGIGFYYSDQQIGSGWEWMSSNYSDPDDDSSYATREIVLRSCAPIPTLSGWGMIIMLFVILMAGVMIIKRGRSGATTAIFLLMLTFSVLNLTIAAEAFQKPHLNTEEARKLCQELRGDDKLRSMYLDDIKGFVESRFDLTEKQKGVLQNISETDLYNVSLDILNSDGDCSDCRQVFILHMNALKKSQGRAW